MDKYRGKQIVASQGPKNAKLVLVSDSPSFKELLQGTPFAGAMGKLLDSALTASGIARSETYTTYCVPIIAPNNDFKKHNKETLEWGKRRLETELAELNPDLVIALGQAPLRFLLGEHVVGYGTGQSINKWRGTVFMPNRWPLVSEGPLINYPSITKRPWPVLATYHPEDIRKNFPWMHWFRIDLDKAAKVLNGTWTGPDITGRKWYINQPEYFPEFAKEIVEHSKLVAVDSEMEPAHIVAFATEWEVHAFVMTPWVKPYVEMLLGDPDVLKVAHNVAHDWIWFEKRLGIKVVPKYLDTMGLAHSLEPEAQKSLSPHISTAYTDWPYHKWLVNFDSVAYCAIDAVVCIDSYWPMIERLSVNKDVWRIAEHDQILNRSLIAMTLRGVKVDESVRQSVETDLGMRLFDLEQEFNEMADHVVDKPKRKFDERKHFFQEKRCPCCGGGKLQKDHCWKCSGLPVQPKKKADYDFPEITAYLPEKWTVAQAKEQLVVCDTCGGTGKITTRLPINPRSPTQMVELLYNGLGIRPRKFKGKVTVRSAQLDLIQNKPPLLEKYLEISKLQAQYNTVKRLHPDSDGRLHCIFDPWGTVSGRVASKEGLVLTGTNLMNVPYEGRRFIVPDPGYVFLYPDMDQIEARCMAILSHDEKLLEIFKRAETDDTVDFHTEVMTMIRNATGLDMNDIRVGPHAGDGRFFSKKSSYAKMYGIRPEQLAKELGIDISVASAILRAYDQTFPGLVYYNNSVESQLKIDRSWHSPTGRFRRFLNRIIDTNPRSPRRGSVDYEILKKALSGQPQDMAAFVLAQGLFAAEEKYPDLLVPLIHVHDALLFEAPEDRLEEAIEAVRDCLTIHLWDILFKCGVSIGNNWEIASISDKVKKERGLEKWIISTTEES